MVALKKVSAVVFADLRVSIAAKNEKFNDGGNFVRMTPARKGLPLIEPDEQEKGSRDGEAVLKGFDCFPSVGGSGTVEFEVTHRSPREVGSGGFQHDKPIPVTGDGAGVLVRGAPAGEENNFVELHLIACPGCDFQVPQMNRIKGAPEECDFSGS